MYNPAGITGSASEALLDEYMSIAHNLANLKTAGYKRTVNSFTRELRNQFTGQTDDMESTGGSLKSGRTLDFTQGTLLNTGRTLDIALLGKGFLQIETPEGPLYTRNGVMHINPVTGQLVDINNNIVSGAAGPVIIPPGVSPNEVTIAEDGNVQISGTDVGRLRVVEFREDMLDLKPCGDNYLMAPEGVAPIDAEETILRQGFQENSNVEMMHEMVNLMSVQRLYEMNMSYIKRQRQNRSAVGKLADSA
jgi:flagellar basal body rod protein FlgG